MNYYGIDFVVDGVEKTIPFKQHDDNIPLWAIGILRGYDAPIGFRVNGSREKQVLPLETLPSSWKEVSSWYWPTRNNPDAGIISQTSSEKRKSGLYHAEIMSCLLDQFYYEVGIKYCGYPRLQSPIECLNTYFDIRRECLQSDIRPTKEDIQRVKTYCEEARIFNLTAVINGEPELGIAIDEVVYWRLSQHEECDVRDHRVVSYLIDRLIG